VLFTLIALLYGIHALCYNCICSNNASVSLSSARHAYCAQQMYVHAPLHVCVNCCRDNTIEADEIPALVRDVLIAGSDTVAAAAAVTLMEIGRIDRGSVLHEQLAAEIQGLNLERRPTYSQVNSSYHESFTLYSIVHIAAWIKRANIYIYIYSCYQHSCCAAVSRSSTTMLLARNNVLLSAVLRVPQAPYCIA
jgi:hypothetical protein